jgi:flagellin-specific chaperone FliS
MIVAKELRQKNIIEYLLYMWHVEEIIRAHKFNFVEIEKNIISKYNQPPETMNDIRNWYRQLINMMIDEDLQEAGHLKFLHEIVIELNDLHIDLFNSIQEEKYTEFYHFAQPILHDLRLKTHKENITEVEACLNGLYGVMILRMQGKPVAQNTMDAIAVISRMMSYLGTKYHQRKG